jgi:pyridoxal phosphate enzyme (YggS family)
MNAERLRDNLDSVRSRIAAAALRAGRDPSAITLVVVTKRTSVDLLGPLLACGVADLGENYPQELWRKVEAAAGLGLDVDVDPSRRLRWHLIGHLQSNKARKTLPLVRMIHAVDSLKLLQTLDGLAAEQPNPPAVCLQVNTSGEATKHGWSPLEIPADAEAIAACRRIPIVGLMTMAALGATPAHARASFAQLRNVRDMLRDRTGLPLPELSMGMSDDFEEAILEGATLVRIGSALFEGVIA